MPPLEEPLSEADRARLAENAARRTSDVMTKGCAAVLKSLMSHRVRLRRMRGLLQKPCGCCQEVQHHAIAACAAALLCSCP